jgi:predicted nuclease of predicted toxin-antitoxin system
LKLLVDENLSQTLPTMIADLFPGSSHVRQAELGSTPDILIWEYAEVNGFAILTKDQDFASLSLTRGLPPKVILLEVGNCSTAEIEHIVRRNAIRFSEFDYDSDRSLLILR